MDAEVSREVNGIGPSRNSLVIASTLLSEIKVYHLRMRMGSKAEKVGKSISR